MWMGKEGVSIGRSQFVQLKLDETDPATTGQYTIEVDGGGVGGHSLSS